MSVESLELQAVTAKLEAYEQTLRGDDPRFGRSVMLVHEDGSLMYFRYAFIVRDDQDWVAIITEHHGSHVYHREELLTVTQLENSAAEADSI